MFARLKRSLVHASIVSLVAAGLATLPALPAAAAPDSDVTGMLLGLDQFATFSKDLAPVGALGKALPLLPLTPGGDDALKLADLYGKALHDPLAVAGAQHFADLAGNYPLNFGDGRTGTLVAATATSGSVDTLTTDVTVARTVASTLHVSTDSPRVDLSVPANVTLTLTSHLAWTYDTGDNAFALVWGGGSPSLNVTAHAALAPSGDAAIGIMGVTVQNTSTFTMDASIYTAVDDPNGDGHLAFTEPGGASGELAAPGAAAGLFHPTLASPAGSAAGHVDVTSKPLTGFSGTGLAASIDVAWANVALGAPTVTATGLDPLARFQYLSPKDLSDGIKHLADTVTALQRAKVSTAGGTIGDINLPFMKGSIADAVSVAETLDSFVANNTQPITAGAAVAGQPKFASVQQFLSLLDGTTGPGGSTLHVSNTGFDPLTNKLVFTLDLARAAADTPLDQQATIAANSGNTVSYTATTLTDTAQAFAPNSLQGRVVSAGGNTATVASNTATVITFTGNWSPATPNAGTAYVIKAADPMTGQVQFGDLLKNAGLAGANSATATATVRPTYDAHLTVVLDLEDPKTGSACDPSADPLRDPTDTATGCPYKRKNLDGSLTVIDEQPPNVDRIQVRTGAPLLSAGLRVDTAVDVAANVGFLKVNLSGHLGICSRSLNSADCSASGDPNDMITLSTKALGDLPMDQIFAMLAHDPSSLLTGDVSARAYASLSATVPDLGGGSFPAMTATLAMDDIRQPTAVTSDLSGLNPVSAFNFNPDNPTQLLGQILKSLRLVSDSLDNVHSSGATETLLGTDMPVVGRSLRDIIGAATTSDGKNTSYNPNGLTDTSATFDDSVIGRAVIIGTYVGVVTGHTTDALTLTPAFTTQPADGTPYAFRSALADALDRLAANPPDNLQQLATELTKALGPNSPVSIGFDAGPPSRLVFDLNWQHTEHTSTAVSFNLASAGIPQDVIGSQVDGNVSITATGTAKLRLLLPLQAGDGPASPADLMVDQDPSHTSVKIGVQADASAFDVTANIGPLALSLGQPNGSDKAQAHANYGASLAATGSGPVSLSTFLSNLSAGIDTSTPAVTCGSDVSQANLALCAHLPLYVNSGGGWTKIDPTDYSINVRLPRTSDTGDMFNLGGAQIDGADRLQTPADLATKIQNAVLDFGALNDGIDRYLAMLEAGLRLASDNGKLPLIGNDVQQGADFIGDVRTEFQNALGSASNITSFDDLSTWGSTTLSNALGFPVKVEATCSYTLDKAGGVAVTNVGASGSTTYTYAVIARQVTTDTAISDPATTGTGNATLDGNNYNHITWSSVVGADAYQIVRSNGSAWDLIATVTGNSSTSYDDKGGAVVQSSYPTTTTTATVTKCTTGVAVDAITGVDFTVDIKSDPNVTFGANGGCASNCTSLASTPLDIGIPGLSLAANGDTAADKKISVDLGWAIHLKFGLNKDKGFVIYTKDGAKPVPELQVGLGLKLPASVTAKVAFLQANISNHNAGNPDLFAGTFGIDLKQKGASTCWTYSAADPACATAADGAPITLGDLADIGDHVAVGLFGGIHIDWNFDAGIDPTLPGLSGEFKLDWAFAAGDAPSKTTGLTISFPSVQLDVGTFLAKLLGPVFKEIKTLTGPLQPIINTLYAPIPVLSDLSHMVGGPDVTLVSIAKAFSTIAGGPDLTFVDRVLAAVQLANKVLSGSGKIDLGSFTVDGATALNTPNTPDAAPSLISGSTPNANAVSDVNNASDPGSQGVVTSGGTGSKAGFKFPLLDDPKKAFGLIMGQDVDLVTFDSGPLKLAFSYSQAFGPVYAPPPVLITISGSASVTAHIKAGFDTYGIRKAIENKKVDIGILDSLYLGTRNDDGTPLQVIQFSGSIGAGAQVSVLVLTVGVEGGITLTVGFAWNDPDNDGKFRFGEFVATAINNPICLFTVSGKLSLYLKVYVTVGISPFSVSFDINLANITLLDFSATPNCAPPPPVLGTVKNGVLIVYAGRLATSVNGLTNLRGDPAYDAVPDPSKASEAVDKVTVTELHDWTQPGHPFIGFTVAAAGATQEFSTRTGVNPDRVLVDGHGFPGALNLTFQGDGDTTATNGGDGQNVASAPFDKDAIVFGGDGPDVIRTGQGRSYVDGGPGDDQITTTDTRPLGMAAGTSPPSAVVAGGAGNDQISVGGGDDWVAGDSSLAWTPATLTGSTQVFDWTTDFGTGPAKGSTADASGDGADTIAVGLGKDTVYGGGGADTIGVASDNPLAKTSGDVAYTSQGVTVVGGGGGDKISTGSGDDTIYTGDQVATTEDGTGSGDAASDVNTVDTGTGNDTVYGGTGQDNVAGHSTQTQVDKFYGGAGNDTMAGGYGQDQIFGGPGDDLLMAEPSQVNGGAATLLPLPANVTPQHKLLVGGDGNDVIYGGDGGADIFGDRHESPCAPPSTNPASDPPAETQTGSPGNDTIYGGNGADVVAAGGGDDTVYANGGDDLVCGQSGNDTLYLGDGNDVGYGGTGDDIIDGGAGNDQVYGNAGQDTLYGGDGNDIIEGNDGSDTEFGGAGDDLVVGGTRAPGRQDLGPTLTPWVGDTLYGDAGDDVLIGDNGSGTGGPGGGPQAYDLDGATPSAGAQDTIYGGTGDDRAFGGLANDTINGGPGDDWLEGNNGDDVINGDAGEDRLVGGSTEQASPGVGRPDGNDVINGGDGADLIAGDNAILTRHAPGTGTPVTLGREFSYGYDVQLLDLGPNPAPGTSGDDLISGGAGADVIYGQGGNDRIKGDAGDDAIEGGPGTDWIEGDAGNDDLVGGSSTPLSGTPGTDTVVGQPDGPDVIWGGPGDDVAIGDNGAVLRTGTMSPVTTRLGSDGNPLQPRQIQLYDLSNGGSLLTPPDPGNYGNDYVSGGAGNDLLYGQDGNDYISGGAGADYIEGNGGADTIRGDLPLSAPSAETAVPWPPAAVWPGSPSPDALLEGAGADGQDDIIGGSSIQGFRDTGDQIEAGGGDDVVLGDNGRLIRSLTAINGVLRDAPYVDRYPAGALPDDATVIRTSGVPGQPTRFCDPSGTTCEPTGAYGADTIYGDAGNDGLWGQDGNDTIHGGAGNDDIFGELGDDTLYGDAGDDAILGDRGGVVDRYINATDNAALGFTVTTSSLPQESYTGFRTGSYARFVDLLHDTDGPNWIGSATSPAMPHNGLDEGGNDQIRGGLGNDTIHAGYGDDLANGDSGGDQVFGDGGADVLWGGQGCDLVLDVNTPDCQTNGVFDPSARGTNDRFVDHVFGGGGGTSAASLAGDLGADLLDFNPRGSYPNNCAPGAWPVTTGSGSSAVTIDPCTWFVMTNKDDDNPADPATLLNNQHHQGTDWLYGGWDRDVMQGDVTANGPNPGDRLIDWTGAYNLYSHCNAAYGGYNDIRLFSPDWQTFLQQLAWGSSAGQTASDVTTPGTSAYRELALVYTSDINAHGSGPAFPSTPGHFDDPAACSN